MAAKKTLTDKQKANSGGKAGRPENLTPFKPGKSGNPKGRPPNEFSITALLREAMTLNTVAGVKVPEGQTIAQALRARLLDEAINGSDFRFFKEVIERIDGKVPDKVITHESAEPLTDPEEAAIATVYGKPVPDDGEDGE